MAITVDSIVDRLKYIPCDGGSYNLVSRKRIGDISLGDDKVSIEIFADGIRFQDKLFVDNAIRSAMKDLGISQKIDVNYKTTEVPKKTEAVKKTEEHAHDHKHDGHSHAGHGHQHDTHEAPAKNPAPSSPQAQSSMANVRAVIAVASGKGGVGKSTVAVNLAKAFEQQGLKVGLLDADIYGPSQPKMLGVEKEKPAINEVTKKMEPLVAHNIKLMSFGFFVPEAEPVIWRGPMLHAVISQFLRDVNWGELDVLVVDLPPGTGDATMSLCQSIPVTGALIVTTPQQIAVLDARKSLYTFLKMRVPVLGIVENMSQFICPDTGKSYRIFGRGGAKALASEAAIDVLAEIPLVGEICDSADQGQPFIERQTTGPVAQSFALLAKRLRAMLDDRNATKPTSLLGKLREKLKLDS